MPRAPRTRRLTWVTLVWLACQTASFAAMPFASCHDHGHGHGKGHSTSHEHAGHSVHDCPMHHHAAGVSTHAHHGSSPSDGPSIRCRCRVSDDALAALMIGTGLLPPAFVLPYDPITTGTSTTAIDAAPRSRFPDTPPPRL